jgi:ubiquinone/menaquinone biosynthesis C-methylase UbiE
MTEEAFTPALGRFAPVRFYDFVAGLMRERVWRGLVVGYVVPQPDDVIVDVGCGTGSLALMLQRRQPEARIVGIDPDREVLKIAAQGRWRGSGVAGGDGGWAGGDRRS